MTLVLYAIAGHDDLATDELHGDGLTLRAVTRGRLAALVADHSEPPEPGEYHRTMERLMGATTILPARFGTVVDSDTDIQRLLSERQDEFEGALERVRGTVELDLRASVADAERGDPSSGTAYMFGLVDRSRRARAIAAELERSFADLVRAGSYRVVDEGATVAASCLIDAADLDEFVGRLEDLERTAAGVTFQCTGPWPPYSFTEAT